MEIILTAKSQAITPFMKSYAKDKVESRLDKFFDRLTSFEIVLDAVKERKVVEFLAHAPGHQIVIKEEDDDMELAIDKAVDRMEMQLKKLKEKLVDNHRRTKEPLSSGFQTQEEEEREETYQEIVDKTDFNKPDTHK